MSLINYWTLCKFIRTEVTTIYKKCWINNISWKCFAVNASLEWINNGGLVLATGVAKKSIYKRSWSETTLTGKSWFHIRTPLGIEPGSLMTGSKRVDHLTSRTVYECSEIAGSPQGSPLAADYVSCEARRRTCSQRETGTEELCEIKWDYHIVGTTAQWQFGTKPASDKATCIKHVGVTNVVRQR